MATIITILHVIVCLFLIFVVLLQAGKGGGMGLAFGGGQAQTMFGGSGAGNFLTRATAITAVLFMLTSLTLAYLASTRGTNWLTDYENRSVLQAKREAALKASMGGGSDAGAATAPAPGLEEGTDQPEPGKTEAPKSEAPKSEAAETPKAETPAPAKVEKPAPVKAAEKPAPAKPEKPAPGTTPPKPADKPPQ
jgi:preprotein translocase subunit SecG